MTADLDAPLVPLDAFALDPAVVHLNHGSFGACPRAALDAQTALRARVEAATMRFFVVEWQPLVDAARARVAAFVGADPDGLAFVPNATTGVATVIASLALAPGDELLATDHTYRACRNALDRAAAATGARVVVAPLAFPVDDPAVHAAAILAAVTPRTRLVLIDHVTSPTALIADVATIARGLASRGVPLLVDGAHAPGMIPLDLAALAARGVHWYVANCHKWMCAPKGAGFLWARADRRAALHPLVTSHGASPGYGPANRFWAEHDWTGTHDPTAYLAIPAALDELARLGGGWARVIDRNHRLAIAARGLLADALGATLPAPSTMLGSMAALPITLPAGLAAGALERALLVDGWEVPIIPGWHTSADPARAPALVRISAQLYNALPDYARLATELLARGVRGA